VKSVATRRFWDLFQALPRDIQELAVKNYLLCCATPITLRFTSTDCKVAQIALASGWGITIAPSADSPQTRSPGFGSARMVSTIALWGPTARGRRRFAVRLCLDWKLSRETGVRRQLGATISTLCDFQLARRELSPQSRYCLRFHPDAARQSTEAAHPKYSYRRNNHTDHPGPSPAA